MESERKKRRRKGKTRAGRSGARIAAAGVLSRIQYKTVPVGPQPAVALLPFRIPFSQSAIYQFHTSTDEAKLPTNARPGRVAVVAV